MTTRSMVTMVAATAVAGVSLTGCMSSATSTNEGNGSGAAQNTSGVANSSAKSSKVAAPIKFGDTVRIKSADGEARYTVTAPKKTAPGPLGLPTGGKKLLAVTVTIVCLNGKIEVNPLYFKARSAEGDNFEVGLGDTENQLDSGSLGPGDKLRGLVPFEVPNGQQIATVSTTDPLLDTTATWHR